MGAILLLAIFMATAMTRATAGLSVSSRDVASKRALQTAKAGLRVAVYRANGLGLDLQWILSADPSQQCLITTDPLTGALGLQGLVGSSWCTAVEESLGTGARFRYRMSPVVGGNPVDQTINNSAVSSVLNRSIVSSGTVDGVTRRVYVQVTALGSTNKVCTSLSLLNVCLTSQTVGSLQTYRITPGSFRECPSTPVSTTAPNPSSDC